MRGLIVDTNDIIVFWLAEWLPQLVCLRGRKCGAKNPNIHQNRKKRTCTDITNGGFDDFHHQGSWSQAKNLHLQLNPAKQDCDERHQNVNCHN